MIQIPTFKTKFDEYSYRLDVAISGGDIEFSHGLADEVLCEIALDTELDFRQRVELVQKWHKVEKWYA
jgi:hypothetical protein